MGGKHGTPFARPYLITSWSRDASLTQELIYRFIAHIPRQCRKNFIKRRNEKGVGIPTRLDNFLTAFGRIWLSGDEKAKQLCLSQLCLLIQSVFFWKKNVLSLNKWCWAMPVMQICRTFKDDNVITWPQICITVQGWPIKRFIRL